MGQTEQTLAAFIADFPADRIPPEVMHIGRRLWINEMAVALFATQDPAIDILLDVFASEGGAGKATVIGKGVRTNLRNAALANGFLGHFEDYDDTHLDTVVHTASPIYPAALAIAEDIGASGKDMLTAGIIGIEVACRIARLIVPKFRDSAPYWHITNTCGVFGAAAAAARLLKLTPKQIEHVLGLAGTQTMGFREVFGSMTKPFHAGKAAENGVMSAILAQRGFTSISAESPGILSGSRGFVAAMAKDYDLAVLTNRLGEHWELPDIAIKPHACGQANHSMLDAVSALRQKPGVSPDTVESIHGRVHRMAPAIANRRHPVKGLEGKFSYHHSIACMLVDGHAFPSQFTDTKVNDPQIKALRDRITVSDDTSVVRRAGAITMKLKDGTTYEMHVEHSVGSPKNPLSDEKLEEKFRVLARTVLPADKVDGLVKKLWALDQVGSVRELVPLFAASERVTA